MTNKNYNSFEKKHQPLATKRVFLQRLLKYALYAFLILALSLAIGTIGYRLYAAISWVDAFLNAAMILTGMGPVTAMPSDGAKLFSAFYAIYSGVAFLTTISILFAPIIHRFLHLMHVEDNENDD